MVCRLIVCFALMLILCTFKLTAYYYFKSISYEYRLYLMTDDEQLFEGMNEGDP